MERDVFKIAKSLFGCSDDKLILAREMCNSTGVSEGKALYESGCGDKQQILRALSQCYSMQSLSTLEEISYLNSSISLVGSASMLKYKFIPYLSKSVIKVLVVDPRLIAVIEDIIHKFYKDVKIKFIIVFENDFEEWLQRAGINDDATKLNNIISDLTVKEEIETKEDDIAYQDDIDQNSIVNIVNRFIIDAVQKGASDIHIEPLEKTLRIRFRLDGILSTQAEIDKRIHKQLVNRIKVASNLDTTNVMTPQSGKMHLIYKGKSIDARVSTLPSIYGETVTLRLINNDSKMTTLEQLGFSEYLCKRIRYLMAMPNGMILVTGPTGSGKSSTLAAMMIELNKTTRSIITIEDPVEFRIDGLTQTNINEGVNLTFASILRESLRQDPDIIMVGEIRDIETARIAISASNTGHLVFSTLHTNSAASSAVRLTEMGLEPFLVASTIRGIINQKLVRVLCPHCKEAYKLPKDSIIREMIKKDIRDQEIELYKPVGCNKCNGTGYKGRTAIIELMEIDSNISKLILSRSNADEIEKAAIQNGMIRAVNNGIELAISGITSIDEVNRVINFGL